MNWLKLCDIPNEVGFRFLGVRRDLMDTTLIPCTVVLRDGLHRIAEVEITELCGWYPMPKGRDSLACKNEAR